MRIAAEPFECPFEVGRTALVIIDMQRDFIKPGGFGETLGNPTLRIGDAGPMGRILVAAAGNAEMKRVHRDVTDRIRIIRRLDFTKQPRIDATYDEHANILKVARAKRGDQAGMLLRAHIESSQADVRKITLQQVLMARQVGR